MPLPLKTLRRMDTVLLAVAFTAAVIAVAFYWTRDWIPFSVAALPWVALPLVPYVIHLVGALRLSAKYESRGAVLSSLAGGLLLALITCALYLPFLDGSLIFYLRWSLGLAWPLLGILALLCTALTWLLVRRTRRVQGAV